MKKFLQITLLLTTTTLVQAQVAKQDVLQSGPMCGYADMREAMLWVQTIREALVFATYYDVQEPGIVHKTAMVATKHDEAYTARLIADSVEPGKVYAYAIYVNMKQAVLPYATTFTTPPLWKWRRNPPEFTLMTGSCAYVNQHEYDRPGTPYGGEYQIFSHMAGQKADLMLWLGDNVYLREPDWNTRTGILQRYTHTRSLPEMQELLATTNNYAIWDDHDYGPNNSNKSFINKDLTLQAFRLFMGNPGYGTSEMPGAISSFQWGDADFFLLDDRWYRDADELAGNNKTMLGSKQLDWLFNSLVSSQATFKIVATGGQFLSDAAREELFSANGFNEERLKIIRFIEENNIKNVIFLTGDVHFTELSSYKSGTGPTIYDFTFSTMSAGPNKQGAEWKNTYRIPGTVVTDRNYGTIRFSGTEKERKITVSCFDSNNVKKWEKTFGAEY